MFAQTHWLIGETVDRIAERRLPGQITPLEFRWGNVLPDLTRPYNQIPHNWNDSSPLLAGLLQQAQEAAFYDRRAFSLRLGMISHFLCDYFCLAHNAPALMDLLPHTVYETRLWVIFKPEKIRCLVLAYLKQDLEVQDFLSFIEIKRREYLKAEPGPETDMVFAIQAVAVVVSNLLCQRRARQVLAA